MPDAQHAPASISNVQTEAQELLLYIGYSLVTLPLCQTASTPNQRVFVCRTELALSAKCSQLYYLLSWTSLLYCENKFFRHLWYEMIVLLCQWFRKEFFLCVCRVFWGGGEPLCGFFWKGLDSNETSKLRQIWDDSFMKTCFCLSRVSLLQMDFFFCQSILAKPFSSVWVFWVSLFFSLLLLTCGKLFCGV